MVQEVTKSRATKFRGTKKMAQEVHIRLGAQVPSIQIQYFVQRAFSIANFFEKYIVE